MDRPSIRSSRVEQRVLNELELLELYSNKSLEDIKSFVHERLFKLISHARLNPWWNNRLGRLDDSKDLYNTLNQLPILSRKEIQSDFESMQVNIPGSADSNFVISSSSGSTGKPVRVRKYVPTFGPHNMATQLLPFRWHELDQGLPMMQLRWNGNSFKSDHTGPPFNFLGPTGSYRAIRISETNFDAIARTIEQEQVGILICSPTALGEIMKAIDRNNIEMENLKAVLTFSERLTSETRTEFARLSGAKIIDRYSSEEAGLIAVDCPHEQHLHQISLHNFVEIVDESNRPCPVGVPGRVLVTGLNSYGMPLIRYELGDFASFGKPCSAGINYPVLVPEIYRLKETLIDRDGQIFTVSAAGSPALKTAHIDDFQVFLFNNAIVLAFFAKQELPDKTRNAIREELQARFRSSSPVVFRRILSDTKFGDWKRRDFIKVDAQFSTSITDDVLLAFT